jgi:dTDP-4-dehydrorhamnose reductase
MLLSRNRFFAKMRFNKILLTGASGTLGKEILKQNNNKIFLTPSRQELDITNKENIVNFFENNEFDAIIHCAAMARMDKCHENPGKAIETNTIGTANLVSAVLKKDKSMRFLQMSSDGVYASVEGNYSEKDETIPYNIYGWSKLGAEFMVQKLKNYCIIRTNFFDPKKIKFSQSATDAFTSKVTIEYIAMTLMKLLNDDFVGVVNVGKEIKSDFDNYKEYNPDLKPCKLKDILKTIKFPFPKDSSMDVSLWKKLEKELQ